jgi:hypothetical protein
VRAKARHDEYRARYEMGSVPGDGNDASAAAKASADEKELLARGIRADRTADDPKRSLLEALGDYMVLCGGDPIDDKWRVEMKMRTNGGTAGSFDVYYFNPENVRFRSRAEAVRHYGLTPVNAPKTASRSRPGGGGAAAGARKPGETLEQVKARRDALEVRRVVDRMLGKVEHLCAVAAGAERREAERAAARAAKAAREAEEKAEREARRAAEKAARDAVKEKEKAEKEKQRALLETQRLAERAAREAEKEARAAEREREKKERAEAREETKAAKEKAREARERRKAEEAETKVKETIEAHAKSEWLRVCEAPSEDGTSSELELLPRDGPGTPPLAFSSANFAPLPDAREKNVAPSVPDALLRSDPGFAGDALEVWSFMDRFREVLFAENGSDTGDTEDGADAARRASANKNKKKRKRPKQSKKAKALAAAAAAGRARDERAPFACMPPTPHALACAMLSDDDDTAAAAVVGALLRPLLAQHAAATTAADAWASALALAPFREAFFGETSAKYFDAAQTDPQTREQNRLERGDVAWQELLRRYLRGAASAMASPPEGGLLGSTARAAADAGEAVCRWVVTGGPTCAPTLPEAGTVLPPAAAAAAAADLERAPRPPAPMSAKADAEAAALCEAELYALGGDALAGPPLPETERLDSSPDAAAKADARRGEALAVLEAARDSAATNAVRQCVRVLAHEEAHRAPAVSRKASRQASGPAGSGPGTAAAAVPGYASVAGGAGFVTAARAGFPRVRDYETIDARAYAGVYDVASLTLPSTQPLDAFLREDAAECGELLKAAGAEKSAPRVVKERLEKARKRGAPESDAVTSFDAKNAKNAKNENGDPSSASAPSEDKEPRESAVVIRGGQYTLFGPAAGALPKAAWDDGCLCCGGDTFGGGVVLLCERCDGEYHAQCLSPPLRAVPEDAWFCPSCERRGLGGSRDGDEKEKEKEKGTRIDSTPALVRRALEGTRLATDVSGAVTSVRGSTKERTKRADRYLELASGLSSSGGWSALAPARRVAILKELTHHLLETASVRRHLDESEKKQNEARDALRRHVRDWPSFWKHGIGSAEAARVAADARAAAEAAEEEAERRDAEAKKAAKAKKEKKGPAGAKPGDGDDDDDDDDGDVRDDDDDGDVRDDDDDDEMDGDDATAPSGTVKEPPSGPSKSHRVRVAGAEAARACLATVDEREGRARWQARWHELERNLLRAESRLETAGLDRAGRAYWLLAPWGELVCQPAGGDAGARARARRSAPAPPPRGARSASARQGRRLAKTTRTTRRTMKRTNQKPYLTTTTTTTTRRTRCLRWRGGARTWRKRPGARTRARMPWRRSRRFWTRAEKKRARCGRSSSAGSARPARF